METKTYTTIDRKGWPSGPWDGEPDKVQWPDEETGLPCLAVRHHRNGHWCGYVGVPPGHPLHGKDAGDVSFNVHWGVNFAEGCAPNADESRSICHVAAEGEPDHVWWFGFDCAHSGDAPPGEQMYRGTRYDDVYRTLDYVLRECKSLAAQIAEHA